MPEPIVAASPPPDSLFAGFPVGTTVTLRGMPLDVAGTVIGWTAVRAGSETAPPEDERMYVRVGDRVAVVIGGSEWYWMPERALG